VGELHRICETAIRHHRAEFDQPSIGKEEPWRVRIGIEPHQSTIQQTARRRRQLWLSGVRTAALGLELEALSHGRVGRKEYVQLTADVLTLTGRQPCRSCHHFAHDAN
jgi:hypothetical protein